MLISREGENSGGYLPHVDGLRALAVGLVVGYHAWPSLVPGGYLGVDIFFVISGFVITRQIAGDMSAGEFSYIRFLGRRLRRLVPASAVCFAIVMLLSAFLLLPDAFEQAGRSFGAAFLMVANFYFYETSGYFSAEAHEKPLLHAWSLSVEDQFYILWPLVLSLALLAGRRLSSRALPLIVIVMLAAGSVIAAQIAAHRDPDLDFYMLPFRAFELLIGCLLALLPARLDRPRPVALTAVASVCVITIAVYAFVPFADEIVPGLQSLPLCGATAGLIWCGLAGVTWIGSLLETRPVVAVGKISYSLYLWHWPLLALARYRMERSLSAWEIALIASVSLVLAAVSWRWVEQPFRVRHSSQGAPQARTFLASAGVGAAAVLLAAGIVLGNGWPWRFNASVHQFFAQMSTSNERRASCDGYENALANEEVCGFGAKKGDGRSYDIAIFGDSNADHFVPMLAELSTRHGLAGRQVTQSTCAPLVGISRKARNAREEANCTRYQKEMLKFIESNPDLQIVVLSAVWPGYSSKLGWNEVAANPTAADPTFDEAVLATVKLLRERKLKVWLFGQVPHLKPLPVRCIVAELSREGDPNRCAAPAEAVLVRLSQSRTLFQELARTQAGVAVFDPATLLCDSELCKPFLDRVFMYKDFGHLNGDGSRWLAQYVDAPFAK